jgi:uncharacterized Fe-S cluster protein YjdI
MHRLYENKDISVFWDSEKCRHAKKCVQGSPATFDPTRRPWIDVGIAETKEIWQAIAECPSGALTCTYNHEVSVSFDEAASCSIAYDGNRRVGECDYQVTAEGWVIYHTEVMPEYNGKGIARRLVYKVTEEAEKRKMSVIPTCSYAKKVLNS